MKTFVAKGVILFGVASAAIFSHPLPAASAANTSVAERRIGNRFLSRTFSVRDGHLRTAYIENKLAGVRATPDACPEFRIRISHKSDDLETPDKIITETLTTDDFRFAHAARYPLVGSRRGDGIAFSLEDKTRKCTLVVQVEAREDEPFMRKTLRIHFARPVTVERVDVEALSLPDAYQPYTLKQIYARGRWKPGLGQPLYTSESGLFFGIEFPAADNFVKNHALSCGYLSGREFGRGGKELKTYAAVLGASDDPAFIRDAFLAYIDAIRIRPLRLQVQYNSWFDFGKRVNRDDFLKSVRTIHGELVVKRGCRPLKDYVIDNGWQDIGPDADWEHQFWPVNGKFDSDFGTTRRTLDEMGSRLGLWLSPGSLFGARRMVPRLGKMGYESLDDWMSLAGPKYMGKLENRMVELTKLGINYFKLDGLFGHLNLRNFDFNGARYGLTILPPPGLNGVADGDARLNDSTYDPWKIYYLTAGTERLIQIFNNMAEADPNVYIVISNGAYLSPWWLMYVDSIWMINAGDAAGGSSRTQELTYRDGVYYELWEREQTQFPLCALFNHEPKKRKTGEPEDTFRRYLFMSLSRGTGFIELYLKTHVLSDSDWDVLAEGLKWAYRVFPTFKHVRMVGGDPREKAVYGYTAWTADQGYLSLHNPSSETREFTAVLDRAFGLPPDAASFRLTSPLDGGTNSLKNVYGYGDTMSLKLNPLEIRILEFSKENKRRK